MSPHFERGVIKIQNELESQLDEEEIDAVEHLKKEIIRIDDDEEVNNNEDMSFAQQVLREGNINLKKRKVVTSSLYKPTNHILPTSNICERLFSIARVVSTHNRKGMTPDNLNRVLFLRFNKNLWDGLTISECKGMVSVCEDEVNEEMNEIHEVYEQENDQIQEEKDDILDSDSDNDSDLTEKDVEEEEVELE